MKKIMCKKDFSSFKKGEIYNYWTNFGGLNHFVSNGIEHYPFDGPLDNPSEIIHQSMGEINAGNIRNWIYDFFYTKEEVRDLKINLIFAQ